MSFPGTNPPLPQCSGVEISPRSGDHQLPFLWAKEPRCCLRNEIWGHDVRRNGNDAMSRASSPVPPGGRAEEAKRVVRQSHPCMGMKIVWRRSSGRAALHGSPGASGARRMPWRASL